MFNLIGYLDAATQRPGPLAPQRIQTPGCLLIVLSVLCFVAPLREVHAIDSLLQQAGKAEEKRVKKAKSADTTALLTLTSGEVVRCKWLARAGDDYRYLREDGKLVSTARTDVAKLEGRVLDRVPDVVVETHVMYCNGEYGKPCVKTISVPAWPAESGDR